jgi:hypothetical protein
LQAQPSVGRRVCPRCPLGNQLPPGRLDAAACTSRKSRRGQPHARAA